MEEPLVLGLLRWILDAAGSPRTHTRTTIRSYVKDMVAWEEKEKAFEEEKAAAEESKKVVEREHDEAISQEGKLKETMALQESKLRCSNSEGLELAKKLDFTVTQLQSAQQRALANEARARKAEAKVKRTEDRATTATEAKAKEAVEEYKTFGAFLVDAEFATTDAYGLGYSNCLTKVGK